MNLNCKREERQPSLTQLGQNVSCGKYRKCTSSWESRRFSSHPCCVCVPNGTLFPLQCTTFVHLPKQGTTQGIGYHLGSMHCNYYQQTVSYQQTVAHPLCQVDSAPQAGTGTLTTFSQPFCLTTVSVCSAMELTSTVCTYRNKQGFNTPTMQNRTQTKTTEVNTPTGVNRGLIHLQHRTEQQRSFIYLAHSVLTNIVHQIEVQAL